jgi:hypothetical protein
VGIDGAKLQQDMGDPAINAQIDADMADANKVRGTTAPPFFFVNGRIVIGVPVMGEIEALIAEEKTKAETFMREQGTPRTELYEAMRKTWRGAQLMGG